MEAPVLVAFALSSVVRFDSSTRSTEIAFGRKVFGSNSTVFFSCSLDFARTCKKVPDLSCICSYLGFGFDLRSVVRIGSQ